MGVLGRLANLGRGWLRVRLGHPHVPAPADPDAVLAGESMPRPAAAPARRGAAGPAGADGAPTAASPRLPPERQAELARLEAELAAGRIGEAEFLRRRAALLAGRDDPEDPVPRTL